MSIVVLERVSINVNTGQTIRHKDKIEWIHQLYVREVVKATFPHLAGIGYGFGMYNQTWDVLRKGWAPTFHMLNDFPEEMPLDEVILRLDKVFGFVDLPQLAEQCETEVCADWYEEDQVYKRDLRRRKNFGKRL